MDFGRLTDFLLNGGGLELNKALFFAINDRKTKALIIELNTVGQLYVRGFLH